MRGFFVWGKSRVAIKQGISATNCLMSATKYANWCHQVKSGNIPGNNMIISREIDKRREIMCEEWEISLKLCFFVDVEERYEVRVNLCLA
jgi:hypothetical protein